MTISPSTSASSLGDVRTRREDLRHRMLELEKALAAASGGDTRGWWERVHRCIGDLRREFDHHVLTTEKPDGFLDEVVAHAPNLARRRVELEREHVTIAADLAALDDAPFVDGRDGVDAVRDAAVRVLGALVRHRHKGSEFIYDAYNVDIGPSD